MEEPAPTDHQGLQTELPTHALSAASSDAVAAGCTWALGAVTNDTGLVVGIGENDGHEPARKVA